MPSPRSVRRSLRFLTGVLALGLAGAMAPAVHAQMPGLPPSAALADVKTRFVPSAGIAVLYEPVNPGPKAQIAFFVMHPSADYLNFSACSELAHRGYRVLCANTTASKTGAFDDGNLDDMLRQASHGVAFLRNLPGVTKVLLFGHSGGATIMTAYQAVAEQGAAFCQDAAKIHKCSGGLDGLPKADGVVLADANWGQAAMQLFSIDPAVKDETNGHDIDPTLDMYNPANGYDPKGSHYPPEFVHRFLAAEGARNNALIARAEQRQALIDAGKGEADGDELFFAPGAAPTANKLFPSDISLLSHTVLPRPLVHKDGSVTVEIVHSVRVATPGMMGPMPSNQFRTALKTTVHDYLSSYAMRTLPDFGYGEDSTIHGVDWHSTYAAPPGNVEGITVPFLTLGMTGNWEGLAAETIFNHAKSSDKSIAFIEGATHIYFTCTRCEKTPGQFGNTMVTVYNYIDQWASKPGRFLP